MLPGGTSLNSIAHAVDVAVAVTLATPVALGEATLVRVAVPIADVGVAEAETGVPLGETPGVCVAVGRVAVAPGVLLAPAVAVAFGVDVAVLVDVDAAVAMDVDIAVG